MLDLHDVKTMCAATVGFGNWLLEIDKVLKVALTLASVVYVVITCKVKYQEYKNKKMEGEKQHGKHE